MWRMVLPGVRTGTAPMGGGSLSVRRALGGGGGGGSCVFYFVAGFAEAAQKGVGNSAGNPRSVAVCGALQARLSLARGAAHAGDTHLPHSASDEGQVGAGSAWEISRKPLDLQW